MAERYALKRVLDTVVAGNKFATGGIVTPIQQAILPTG
jgi:hypothetical protein